MQSLRIPTTFVAAEHLVIPITGPQLTLTPFTAQTHSTSISMSPSSSGTSVSSHFPSASKPPPTSSVSDPPASPTQDGTRITPNPDLASVIVPNSSGKIAKITSPVIHSSLSFNGGLTISLRPSSATNFSTSSTGLGLVSSGSGPATIVHESGVGDTPRGHGTSSSATTGIVGGVLGFLLLVAIVACLLFYRHRKRTRESPVAAFTRLHNRSSDMDLTSRFNSSLRTGFRVSGGTKRMTVEQTDAVGVPPQMGSVRLDMVANSEAPPNYESVVGRDMAPVEKDR